MEKKKQEKKPKESSTIFYKESTPQMAERTLEVCGSTLKETKTAFNELKKELWIK